MSVFDVIRKGMVGRHLGLRVAADTATYEWVGRIRDVHSFGGRDLQVEIEGRDTMVMIYDGMGKTTDFVLWAE